MVERQTRSLATLRQILYVCAYALAHDTYTPMRLRMRQILYVCAYPYALAHDTYTPTMRLRMAHIHIHRLFVCAVLCVRMRCALVYFI